MNLALCIVCEVFSSEIVFCVFCVSVPRLRPSRSLEPDLPLSRPCWVENMDPVLNSLLCPQHSTQCELVLSNENGIFPEVTSVVPGIQAHNFSSSGAIL